MLRRTKKEKSITKRSIIKMMFKKIATDVREDVLKNKKVYGGQDKIGTLLQEKTKEKVRQVKDNTPEVYVYKK